MPKLPRDKTEILQAAKRLHAAGWWVVPQAGKQAVVLGWPQIRLSESDLEEYLSDGKLNIAVVLSQSAVMDVECDSEEAEAELLRLCGTIPRTPTWKSRRGLHRLFLRPEGLPQKSKIEINGIEFRLGLNPALSTVPPSIHPDDGTVYRWLPMRGPDVPPAELPKPLLDLLLSYKGGRKKVRDEEASVEEIGEGRRNDELFRLGSRAARAMPLEEVESYLHGKNAKCCKPPLPDAEVEGIVKSIRELHERSKTDICSLRCDDWNSLVSAWEEALEWRKGIEEVFAVMLAVAASTIQMGNQLFMQVVGEPGSAKCLGKGTPILMYDGSVLPVEQVQEGDLVMGPDSLPRTVESTTTGSEKMYRVTPVKGDPYVVNESHVLSLRMTGSGKEGFGETFAKDLLINLPVWKYLQQSNLFKAKAKGWRVGVEWEERPVPLDPYFVGIWLGDGDSRDQTITSADDEVRDFLESYAARLGLTLSCRLDPEGVKCPRYNICHKKGSKNIVREGLRELRLLHNKHIPSVYKVNSRFVRLNVLAGLLDSDGTLGSGTFSYTSISKTLCEDVLYLCRSLGLAAYMSSIRNQCTTNGVWGDYWRISISGDCDMIPTKITRKQASSRKQSKNVLRTGIRVDPIGYGDYYGFSVDGDGLFLLGDFTVTHNTRLCEAMLVSKYCKRLERINGVFSGTLDYEDKSKDFSFLSRSNGLCWITPEADLLASSPGFSEMMSQMRRVFDGSASVSYKNRDHEMEYSALRTPWIMAGTPAMLDRRQSSLGDRFLRIYMDQPTEEVKRRILKKVGLTELDAVLMESTTSADSTLPPKMLRAYRLTGGYVDYLRANVTNKLRSLKIDKDRVTDRTRAMADWTAHMRSAPPEMQYGREPDYSAIKELPSRLQAQFVRLALCLTVVYGKSEVDDEVLDLVRRVAVDTGRGRSQTICEFLAKAGRGGIVPATLAVWMKEDEAKVLRWLLHMEKVQVVEWYSPESNGVMQLRRWRLTAKLQQLYQEVFRG